MNKSNQKQPGKASLKKNAITSVSARHFTATNSIAPNYVPKDNIEPELYSHPTDPAIWTIKIFLN
jgi:hypothetical protein